MTKVVRVTFDTAMDTSVTPDLPDWDVLVNGVPIAIDLTAWFDAVTCDFTYTDALDPGGPSSIRLLFQDDDCRSTIGAIAAFPQTEPFFP